MSQVITINNKVVYEIKKSIFIAYSFEIFHKEEVKKIVEQIKNKHNDANHICYAWRLNKNNFGFYDANEPKGSAGQPIFKILEHQDIVEICVIVVRYFGGIKLGVGPLAKAYLQSAKMVIESSQLTNFVQKFYYKFSFSFLEQKQFWNWSKQVEFTETQRKMENNLIHIYFESSIKIEPPYFGKLEQIK